MTHPLNRIKSTGYSRDITRDDRVNRSLPAGPDISIRGSRATRISSRTRAVEDDDPRQTRIAKPVDLPLINFRDR